PLRAPNLVLPPEREAPPKLLPASPTLPLLFLPVPILTLQQVELMELQGRVTRAEAARLKAETGRMAAETDYGPLRKSFNRVGSHAATLRRAYSTSQTEG
ncbi:hypothetical protein E4U35_002311, partial [Claviceps purpurea]